MLNQLILSPNIHLLATLPPAILLLATLPLDILKFQVASLLTHTLNSHPTLASTLLRVILLSSLLATKSLQATQDLVPLPNIQVDMLLNQAFLNPDTQDTLLNSNPIQVSTLPKATLLLADIISDCSYNYKLIKLDIQML